MKKKYKYIISGFIDGHAVFAVFFGLLALGIASLTSQAATEDLVESRLIWEWSEGQSRSYRLELERTQRTVAGNRYSTKFNLRCDLVFASTSADADGASLQLLIDNLSISVVNGERTQRFSSATPAESAPEATHPWAIAGRAIVRQPLEIIFSSCGSIMIEEGLESQLEKSMRNARDASPRERFEIMQFFGDDGLTNLLNSMFSILPLDSKFADEWSRERSIDLAPGISLQKRELYSASSSGDDALEIGMRANLELEEGEVKELNLPQGRIEVEVKEFNTSGTTSFSRHQGCILSQQNTGRMRLEMTVFADSEQEQVHSELRQTTRLRLFRHGANGGR